MSIRDLVKVANYYNVKYSSDESEELEKSEKKITVNYMDNLVKALDKSDLSPKFKLESYRDIDEFGEGDGNALLRSYDGYTVALRWNKSMFEKGEVELSVMKDGKLCDIFDFEGRKSSSGIFYLSELKGFLNKFYKKLAA